MSKLLKHLGFGGKKSHKSSVDNKHSTTINDNQIRNNSAKTNISAQEPTISRIPEIKDVLKQTRRLPAHRNENTSDKIRNNIPSSARGNKGDILQHINQTSDFKKHKNQSSKEHVNY